MYAYNSCSQVGPLMSVKRSREELHWERPALGCWRDAVQRVTRWHVRLLREAVPLVDIE